MLLRSTRKQPLFVDMFLSRKFLMKKAIYCFAFVVFCFFARCMINLIETDPWTSLTPTDEPNQYVTQKSFVELFMRLQNTTHPQGHQSTLISTNKCSTHLFLLILVSSSPSNIERRKDIRRTWGADNSTKPRWKAYFLIAQTRGRNLSQSLLHEGDAFGDLIRADYFDDYWNQTLKIQMGFEWASRYCNFSFLLKIDDDVFVNMNALLSNLTNPSMPKYKLYMGLLWQKLPVRRYKGDKWEVTKEEYEPDFYPDYCPGFGFVLSFDVVHSFVNLYQVVKPFKIDDVYVGMLAERAGVNGTNNHGFKEKPSPPIVPCTFDNTTLLWHGITGECLFKLFRESLMRYRLPRYKANISFLGHC